MKTLLFTLLLFFTIEASDTLVNKNSRLVSGDDIYSVLIIKDQDKVIIEVIYDPLFYKKQASITTVYSDKVVTQIYDVIDTTIQILRKRETK